MKKILTSIILLLTIIFCSFLNAQYLSIYRNDGLRFNQMKMTENDSIAHTLADSASVIVSDIVNGRDTIPMAAIDSCVVRMTDIPVLRFSFPDYPEADMLWEKELYITTILNIEGNGYTEDAENLELKVKGRGNSTWGMPKKPMRLKFSKKTSICGLKKAKNYVLLNNYLDPSMMRNAIAMWLAREMGVPYANHIIPCHVFINDNYAGAYTLTEKVGINGSSVDIEESEGILFELSTEFDEKYRFYSEKYKLPVMVKDPDFDELYDDDPSGPSPEDRLKMWQTDFTEMERTVKHGKADEVVDLESAVNYLLLYELVGNFEIVHPKSIYMHKKSLEEGEKYYMGPAWDFDVAFNLAQPAEDDSIKYNSPEHVCVLPTFFQHIIDNEKYQELYKQRKAEVRDDIFPRLMQWFDEYAELINPSAKLNGIRWPEEKSVLIGIIYSLLSIGSAMWAN